MRVLSIRNGAHAGAAEGGVVEGDEDFLGPGSLGLIQPMLQLLHLFFVRGPGSSPAGGRAIVVFAGPQEDEASAVEIELVDEPLVRNPELFQIGKGTQQAFDVGVVPYFVIAHGGENTARQTSGPHFFVGAGNCFNTSSLHQLPVGVLRGSAALSAPPNDVPGINNELGPPAFYVFHNLAGNPLAALQPEHRAAHARKQLYVLDRGFGDPAFVQGQGGDFASV